VGVAVSGCCQRCCQSGRKPHLTAKVGRGLWSGRGKKKAADLEFPGQRPGDAGGAAQGNRTLDLLITSEGDEVRGDPRWSSGQGISTPRFAEVCHAGPALLSSVPREGEDRRHPARLRSSGGSVPLCRHQSDSRSTPSRAFDGEPELAGGRAEVVGTVEYRDDGRARPEPPWV
jgi:hypothetical protein